MRGVRNTAAALALPAGPARQVRAALLRVGKPGQAPLYKQGTCRVCRIPIYGYQETPREVCGDPHCHAETGPATRAPGRPESRKHPCRFKRLRNLPEAR